MFLFGVQFRLESREETLGGDLNDLNGRKLIFRRILWWIFRFDRCQIVGKFLIGDLIELNFKLLTKMTFKLFEFDAKLT